LLKERTADKEFDPKKNIRGVQPIELKYSDQKIIESAKKPENVVQMVEAQRANVRESFKTNFTNNSELVYNTQGMNISKS
jgi:hypothetical protein